MKSARGWIVVAFNEKHLLEKLKCIFDFRAAERISAKALPRLVPAIGSFILTGALPVPSGMSEEFGREAVEDNAPAVFELDAK